VEKEIILSKEKGTSRYYGGDQTIKGLQRTMSVRRPDGSLVEIPRPFTSMAVSLVNFGLIPESLKELFPPLLLQQIAENRQRLANDPNVGKISFQQEGGCKARVVCQPSIWLQAYLRPLADFLLKVISMIELEQTRNPLVSGFSVLRDQVNGAELMSKWMREDKAIFSFDLSSATDRFPRSLQLAVLEGLGLKEWTKAIEDVAKSTFLCKEAARINPSGKPEEWSYTVGQPMGTSCSMPLFHLTHYMLLDVLAHNCQSPPNSFAVLGDDVIICDKKLAERYSSLIKELGLDISSSKSYITTPGYSATLQTFAGFTSMYLGGGKEKGSSVFTWRPFKHGPNFKIEGRSISLLHSVGHRSRKWSDLWRNKYLLLKSSYIWRRLDLSPVTPETYGFPVTEKQRLASIGVLQPSLALPGADWMCSLLQGQPPLTPYYGDPGIKISYPLTAIVWPGKPRPTPSDIVECLRSLFPQENRAHIASAMCFSPYQYVGEMRTEKSPWTPYQVDISKDPVIRNLILYETLQAGQWLPPFLQGKEKQLLSEYSEKVFRKKLSPGGKVLDSSPAVNRNGPVDYRHESKGFPWNMPK